MCYNKWEMRSSPRGLKFCPYCGAEWAGKHKCKTHDEKYFRFPRIPKYVKYPNPVWQLMSNTKWTLFDSEGLSDEIEVEHDINHKDTYISAKNALRYLRGRQSEFDRMHSDGDTFNVTYSVRIKKEARHD